MTTKPKSTAKQRAKAKRVQRGIYFRVARLMDPETGEEVGALVPTNLIDRRLLRERGLSVDSEVRAELSHPRNAKFHRLAHAVGHLLVDNVEEFQHRKAHDVLKEIQRRAGVMCETMELDLGPLGKVPVRVARSLAFDEMEEDEFRGFFDGVTAYIAEHFAGVMLDEVRAEFWQMVEGK